ncbi:MAG: transcriptional regulator [Thermotogae bacterium]|uniref:ArsR/SmtB family transcription factor n=1 Tax=Kosmotoga sp. TaxID=1955248 RepID=UPI000F1B8406|nr:metalloregulator ArsR/SmtB family transcription factor [Kosmotoga sp.]MBO8166085.1 winged helix-turn-helix transcriptional regulator [Kosmotoga sp.]MCD6159211.1 winged helix-turn-helix transcriptional regulator [Kosmotoga sp.]RKX48828.1 MAG: transcriptional regulator [Thermotogota bacterium]
MKKKDYCQVHQVHINTEEFKKRANEISGLSELFKVLADETRTKIIYLLSLKELCTCDLSEILGITLPSVSHHLRLLKAFRIVKYRREGKTVFYSLADKHIMDLINVAKEHFEEFLEE